MSNQNRHLLSLWDDAHAAGLDEVDLLVYRSNLLGSDPRITNFGGGNTSAKATVPDPLTGEPVEVMWVKGSGGDLGTMKRAGLASLYLGKVLGLEKAYQNGTHEDDIVALYNHCTFNLNPTACSIDTPLHAFIPKAHVDHMHSDAIIAVAAAEGSEELTKEVFGGEVGWVPWKRPGFELGLMLRDLYVSNPNLKGAVMGSHGFICWADTAKECYELTLRLVNQAIDYIDAKTKPAPTPMSIPAPTESLVSLLPKLRGKVMFNGQRLIAHVDQSDDVHAFLAHPDRGHLAQLGTSCPDHFLRTKIRPMVLEGSDIDAALASYREGYAQYYERCKKANSPAMRNPNPSVVLIPGHGMVTFGKTKQEAMVTAEFYRRAIEVMKGAETLSKYTSLPEQEAFDIEYWLLEEAKLKRMPAEKEFSRQVAVVTGGAQGIGLATARKLAQGGACVVVLDLNAEKLAEAVADLEKVAPRHVLGIPTNVTDLAQMTHAFEQAILQFGGVDICVVNAGNARRGTIADTTDADYDFLSDLLMKAYFTTMRAATQVMLAQGTGGSIVVVGSKNGVAVGSNAAIYSATKAFELHLMRTAANDLAKHGIRANAVNPDAVLQGSGIWSDAWREQTAKSLGISIDELPDYYRKRSMLSVAVEPDHVAEAICWLASEHRSSRTTGAVIPVDGGVREGFLR